MNYKFESKGFRVGCTILALITEIFLVFFLFSAGVWLALIFSILKLSLLVVMLNKLHQGKLASSDFHYNFAAFIYASGFQSCLVGNIPAAIIICIFGFINFLVAKLTESIEELKNKVLEHKNDGRNED